jgi:hypothetical protein
MPSNDQEPNASDIPEATKEAMQDTGWIVSCLYIQEVANQIFGVSASVIAIPDPDAFFRKAAGKEGDRPGIFVTIDSNTLEGLGASMVVPYDAEALGDIRIVMNEMALKLRTAEEQHAEAQSKLIVPEKKLIIPGQE